MSPVDKAARRTAIINAARTVFARDGYTGTKVIDIAEEAGCSVGTLYSYFTDREDLLRAVLENSEDQFFSDHPYNSPDASPSSEASVERITQATHNYLENFKNNADAVALMEELALTKINVKDYRTSRLKAIVGQNVEALTRGVAAGIVTLPEGADAEMVATALSAMVSRMAHAVWIDKHIDDDEETLARMETAINAIWFRALGLEDVASQMNR